MLLPLSLAAAAAGGLVARRLRLPGGLVFGAMVATAAVVLGVGEVALPQMVRLVIFVGVGTMIGMLVTRDTLRALPSLAVQALVSAVLLIGSGILVALLLRGLDLAPLGDVLATSPGALSVLSAAAAAHDLDAPMVALFHIVRIVLILLTLPLLVKLLPDRAPAADEAPAGEGPGAAERARPVQLLATAAAAAAGGLAALQVGISGALIFGTTVGAAAVTLAYARSVSCPPEVRLVVQIGIGWMIGTLVTQETVAGLGSAILPAVLAAVLVIGSGVGIAYVLRRLGYAPPGDVLATSPGAFDVLATTAVEHDAGAVQVALFHTVRILLVILSLPLLLTLVP